MAKRPVFFVSHRSVGPRVDEIDVEFTFYSGFAISQAQRSIRSLHDAARAVRKTGPLLEISSRSPDPDGVSLSAFNLRLDVGGDEATVESTYQGSKVFETAGPFPELIHRNPKEARKAAKTDGFGRLLRFELLDRRYPLRPTTAFYDWLYLTALIQNPKLAESVGKYEGFTDIAFNPDKSLNCQARSAALFVSLSREGVIADAMADFDSFVQVAYRASGGTTGSQVLLG